MLSALNIIRAFLNSSLFEFCSPALYLAAFLSFTFWFFNKVGV